MQANISKAKTFTAVLIALFSLAAVGLTALPQTVQADGDANIVITKTDNRDLTRPGHTLTYTITVENTGGIDIHDLEIEDDIPFELQILAVSDGGQIEGKKVRWTNVTVEAQGKQQVTVTAKVKEDTPNGFELCNWASAESEDHCIYEETGDCTVVKQQPEVAAAVEETPQPRPVPVTAPTGANASYAGLIALIGGSGLALMARKGI
jgi:uncharacterized repeat protein (TIGR01451 family)